MTVSVVAETQVPYGRFRLAARGQKPAVEVPDGGSRSASPLRGGIVKRAVDRVEAVFRECRAAIPELFRGYSDLHNACKAP